MPTAVQEAHAAHTTTGPGTVRVGDMTLGEGPPAVIGGAPGGADATSRPMGRWLSLRGHHGARDARRALTEERARWRGPLLVEPFSAADLPAIGDLADGVIVGAAWMQDFRLVRAAARLGLPMVVQRGPGATAQEWLAIVDYCAAEGNDRVVLCECGDRTRGAEHALNLGLMRAVRARSGRPVLVHLGTDAGLAGAAVAAGADGVLLAPEAGEETVAAAVEATALAAAVTVPTARRAAPRTVADARAQIDRVDAALAVLLERRAELAGVVQRLKPVGGFAGRDMERERRLVAAMARRAPRLGEARLARIMNAVIEAGLELAEQDRRRGTGR
ncbi:DAHP synthetase I family protein [Thermostaphylospora chromogena]|uniref:DAHP synthetase I family protein n=1 Tax=Thermostaphylospora chromogena TaxID=35622 RepID=A0A1H1GDC2_9ACTN|nr:DAHP synthetase I family protein [Thermostaphylospora chromogena]